MLVKPCYLSVFSVFHTIFYANLVCFLYETNENNLKNNFHRIMSSFRSIVIRGTSTFLFFKKHTKYTSKSK